MLLAVDGRTASPAAMLLRALAAPVFADSMIFLKKPLFFGLGATSPPRRLLEFESVVLP
jgi:hypothetical protein